MHKLNSASQLKTILSDVVSIAFQHMGALASELKELDINNENIKSKTQEQVAIHQTISNILTIINDVIHPAHEIAPELFEKDVTEFVNFCIKNQKLAVEKKLISHTCKCYSCKSKGIK